MDLVITVHVSPHHHPISWKSILIVSSHLHLGLTSGFHTETPHSPLFSPTRATCSNHVIILEVTRTIFGEQYTSRVQYVLFVMCTAALFSFIKWYREEQKFFGGRRIKAAGFTEKWDRYQSLVEWNSNRRRSSPKQSTRLAGSTCIQSLNCSVWHFHTRFNVV